jgi:hypothetical protein
MEKPQAKMLCVTRLIDGDPEIECIEVHVHLKPGISGVSSTLHTRAAGLFIVQSQDPWLKFCIETKTDKIA